MKINSQYGKLRPMNEGATYLEFAPAQLTTPTGIIENPTAEDYLVYGYK